MLQCYILHRVLSSFFSVVPGDGSPSVFGWDWALVSIHFSFLWLSSPLHLITHSIWSQICREINLREAVKTETTFQKKGWWRDLAIDERRDGEVFVYLQSCTGGEWSCIRGGMNVWGTSPCHRTANTCCHELPPLPLLLFFLFLSFSLSLFVSLFVSLSLSVSLSLCLSDRKSVV